MKEQRKQNIAAFFTRLDGLTTGERALLKRAAGTMLCNADGRAMTVFYRVMPGQEITMEDRWFAVACFSCLWDAGSEGIELERILSVLKTNSDAMEHRIASLFDLRWEPDGYFLTKLCRIIKMARQKGYCVDCAALLEDLLYWNADTQFVQRKWARTMYKITDTEQEKGEQTDAV